MGRPYTCVKAGVAQYNVCPTGTKPVLGPNSLHDTIYMVLTSDGFSQLICPYSRAASTEQRSKLIDHDGHSVWKL